MKYEKPLIELFNAAEGVYAASGMPKCDSQYINGVFHAPDYNNVENYISRFGCHGCPAFRENGCGLQMEDYWASYNADNGNRYPNWERAGYKPYDQIDWNNVSEC